MQSYGDSTGEKEEKDDNNIWNSLKYCDKNLNIQNNIECVRKGRATIQDNIEYHRDLLDISGTTSDNT